MVLNIGPDYQLHKSWIEKCDEDRDRLSKWESDFVDSVNESLEKYGKLSYRQAEILERIYTDKTR